MAQLNPEIQLDSLERAHLAAMVPTAGFKVLQKIMRSEVDKFVVAMVNADPANEKDVIAAHYLAKAAAQFYQMIADRINEEVTLYTNMPKPSDKPVDVTEGLIDLGELAAQLPNVDLGGEENE